jgi:hypothetical protein
MLRFLGFKNENVNFVAVNGAVISQDTEIEKNNKDKGQDNNGNLNNNENGNLSDQSYAAATRYVERLTVENVRPYIANAAVDYEREEEDGDKEKDKDNDKDKDKNRTEGED